MPARPTPPFAIADARRRPSTGHLPPTLPLRRRSFADRLGKPLLRSPASPRTSRRAVAQATGSGLVQGSAEGVAYACAL